MTKMKMTGIAAAMLLAATAASNAAILVSYNTGGNLGTETSEPTASVDASVTATALAVGPGITPAGNGNRLGGTDYAGATGAPGTLADAISGNEYFQFTVTPVSGNTVTASDFTFIFDHSSTGANAVALRASTDGFATTTDLGQVTGIVASGTTFSTIDFADFVLSGTTTFRAYGFGATASTGTAGFDKATSVTAPNVVLNGSSVASQVPEPATLAALAGFAVLGLRRRSR